MCPFEEHGKGDTQTSIQPNRHCCCSPNSSSGTTTPTKCILTLLNDKFVNMKCGKLTGVIFLDLTKAFDAVDHKIMLNNLDKFNLFNTSIKWFGGCLSKRIQSVFISWIPVYTVPTAL